MEILKRLNLNILAPAILLGIFGCLTLASLSASDVVPFQAAWRQIIWFVLGLAVFFLISYFFNHRVLFTQNFFTLAIYTVCLILLIAVLVFGTRVRGTSGWLNFPLLRFQPVELAKLALIILLAKYFSHWHFEIWRLQRLLVPAIYTGFYVVLTILQPDFGSAVLLVLIWFGMLLVAGMKFKHFVIFVLIGLIIFGFSWNFIFKQYQKERILNFFNPGRDPLGSGYNVIQAKIAIGSGGFWGRGLGQGVETQLRFLPEAKTDFFLAAFIEEWGFFGGTLLCLIFAWLISQLMTIGLRARDNFSRLFVFGYLLLLISQIFINFGANLGFLPVTGLPLSFLSYGGSNLLINFIALGIIQSIKLRSIY